ncbi:MAG: DegT/DnrJ/EryC1/StrS family aminotransferase [Deltaproteobacteria bacterium]|nr:DegT/DnrJ/EryC1/StrS family aminotransferase [Deltaproteobacteria bacterium]
MSRRTVFLPFHIPDIGDQEISAVAEVLRSGWLTTGPKVHAFEQAFASYIGVPYAVAVNSCTAALHLALEAIGLAEGDEVLVPTMTFAATAEVVTYFRARPVLVDCEPDTLNLDPSSFERAITPRSRAVIPVHYAGHVCDMDRILPIARHHRLKVVEDAAHALPAHYQGKMAGTLSDLACFSFYATKTLCTGEGGMVTTANPEYAERVRMMSLHGISKDAWKRYSAEGSWYYEILSPGFKYNLTDVAAALGLVQLGKCDHMLKSRRRIAELYNEAFRGMRGITTPVVRTEADHAWHLYPIRLALEQLRIGRSEFIAMMRERNIGTGVHFIPLHIHPYYRDLYNYRPEDFPNASDAYERLVSLPIYPAMSDRDAHDVVSAIDDIITHNLR